MQVEGGITPGETVTKDAGTTNEREVPVCKERAVRYFPVSKSVYSKVPT